jgi:signal peptidase
VSTQSRRRTWHLGSVVVWSVILCVSAAIALAVVVPRIVGGTPYVILTGSMRPTMPPGTLVVTRPVDADTLGPGAVVTYQLVSGEPTVVTHRVVGQGINAVGERVFRTKGDANSASDPGWVRAVQIRGERWYAVPYLGYLTSLIGSGERDVLQTLIVSALVLYGTFMFTSAARGRWRRRTVTA